MKLVITGGGTGGHIQPLVAIVSALRAQTKNDLKISWLASRNGMEYEASQKNDIPFYNIPAGKLRRYFDWRNFTDIFKTAFGTIKAFFILGKLKPDVIFSKGGFVSFPVVFAGFLRRIPIIAHESDVIPGLTTKICIPFVTQQCLGFTSSKKHLKKWSDKLVVTGIPLRESILNGNREKGLKYLHIKDTKQPIVLIIGGSLGAKKINEAITKALPQLVKTFTLVHMTGVGKQTKKSGKNYSAYTFFNEELADIYQAADIIVSRAGATTLAELLTLNKRTLLIPLGKDQSRGDQIINAETVRHLKNIRVLPESNLSTENIVQNLQTLQNVPKNYQVPKQYSHLSATNNVIKVIQTLYTQTTF